MNEAMTLRRKAEYKKRQTLKLAKYAGGEDDKPSYDEHIT